ncbi:ABC transporter permease subunit [Pseudarthrobacter sp. NIBRBAC000502772]|uniref:ABC transporter permease subunit n=1 Tax=Pseudarthrobacter sp. NIBRBAC000502772 TaxID=2590775 RepID=UPI00143D5C8E
MEAARIDAANETTIITRILMPAVRGPIVSLGVFVFVGAWNEYIWPSRMAPRPRCRSSQSASPSWPAPRAATNGPTMAAATLVAIPISRRLPLIRRQIVSAVAAGAVHG